MAGAIGLPSVTATTTTQPRRHLGGLLVPSMIARALSGGLAAPTIAKYIVAMIHGHRVRDSVLGSSKWTGTDTEILGKRPKMPHLRLLRHNHRPILRIQRFSSSKGIIQGASTGYHSCTDLPLVFPTGKTPLSSKVSKKPTKSTIWIV